VDGEVRETHVSLRYGWCLCKACSLGIYKKVRESIGKKTAVDSSQDEKDDSSRAHRQDGQVYCGVMARAARGELHITSAGKRRPRLLQ
jgi:hypothetical protein